MVIVKQELAPPGYTETVESPRVVVSTPEQPEGPSNSDGPRQSVITTLTTPNTRPRSEYYNSNSKRRILAPPNDTVEQTAAKPEPLSTSASSSSSPSLIPSPFPLTPNPSQSATSKHGTTDGRAITNYVNIVRKASSRSMFTPTLKIDGTFHIDPHLRISSDILNTVKGVKEPNTGGENTDTPANINLQLYDGTINVTICLVADDDPRSSSGKRKGRISGTKTVINALLSTTKPKSLKAYPLTLKLVRLTNLHCFNGLINPQHAPQPRPPLHLTASTPASSGISRSPVTLFLPRSFHGPLIVRAKPGNIDNHVWLSPTVRVVASIMSGDDQHKGYFIGQVPDAEDEASQTVDAAGGKENEPQSDEKEGEPTIVLGGMPKGNAGWKGDVAEIRLGGGKLRVLYEDEVLEGVAEALSKGWLMPDGWSQFVS